MFQNTISEQKNFISSSKTRKTRLEYWYALLNLVYSSKKIQTKKFTCIYWLLSQNYRDVTISTLYLPKSGITMSNLKSIRQFGSSEEDEVFGFSYYHIYGWGVILG